MEARSSIAHWTLTRPRSMTIPDTERPFAAGRRCKNQPRSIGEPTTVAFAQAGVLGKSLIDDIFRAILMDSGRAARFSLRWLAPLLHFEQ